MTHPPCEPSCDLSSSFRKGIFIIGLLFATAAALTLWLDLTGLDVEITDRFFVECGPYDGWAFSKDPRWSILYEYGEIPGILLGVSALGLYWAARTGRAPGAYVKPSLVVALTVALGPGLLINGACKGLWGRPRPADTTIFGGEARYRNVWEPAGPGGGKSFCCGHCSMGFAFASAAAFAGLHPALGGLAMGVGLGMGAVMGIGRVAQGGHFPTDVIWSGALTLSVAAALHFLILPWLAARGNGPPGRESAGNRDPSSKSSQNDPS